jgi:hypothetical protein
LQDEDVIQKLREKIAEFHEDGKKTKIAVLDIDLTFPGEGIPWKSFILGLQRLGRKSLVDDTHDIGCIE